MSRWIFFAAFILYYTVLATSSYLSYGKIASGVLSGRIPRTHVYYSQMAGMWIPTLALLALAACGAVSFRELGLSWVLLDTNGWLVVTGTILYIVYLVYLIFSLRSMKRAAASGKANNNIPEQMRALYPAAKHDKQVWIVTAVSVGITEELLFRGFLIGSTHLLFPAIPLVAVLIFSSLLFGAGHLYQGVRNVAIPTLLGALLGLFFIAFGSVLPGIVLHILQDIGAVYVMKSPLSPAGDIPPSL